MFFIVLIVVFVFVFLGMTIRMYNEDDTRRVRLSFQHDVDLEQV